MNQNIYDPVSDSFKEISISQYIQKLKHENNSPEEIKSKLKDLGDEIGDKVNELIPTDSQKINVEFGIVDGNVVVKPIEVVEVPDETLQKNKKGYESFPDEASG